MLYILKACSEKNIKILPTVYHTCIGYNFGEIEIKLSGDVKQPVKYLWEDGSSNAVRRNLGKGSYTVLVTDADKCTDQMTIAITDEIPLTNSPKTDPCVTQYYCRQYEAYNVPSALPPECGYLDLTDCRKYICRCPLTQQIMANPNRTDNYKELRVKVQKIAQLKDFVLVMDLKMARCRYRKRKQNILILAKILEEGIIVIIRYTVC